MTVKPKCGHFIYRVVGVGEWEEKNGNLMEERMESEEKQSISTRNCRK